ncbi:hypothetical protein VIN14_00640 [Lacticaseibacillus casei]|uniref:hypothetical protein n=1 Tax=Lacticaseibacillus casei TaxID=1582 RepID=UPI000ABE3728|nr:hypothetical protein [Lacticaseibacillus casei]
MSQSVDKPKIQVDVVHLAVTIKRKKILDDISLRKLQEQVSQSLRTIPEQAVIK